MFSLFLSAQPSQHIECQADQRYLNLYLIRHGETHWNAVKPEALVQGSSDIELNKNGIDQAQAAAKIVSDFMSRSENGDFEFYTSPLKRAAKTAEIIGAEIELTPKIENRLTAGGWGVCEGKPVSYRKTFHTDETGRYRGKGIEGKDFQGNPYQDWTKMNTIDRWKYQSIPQADSLWETAQKMKGVFETIQGSNALICTHQENIIAFRLFCQLDEIESLRQNGDFDAIHELESKRPVKNCEIHQVTYDRETKQFTYKGKVDISSENREQKEKKSS